LSSIAWCVLSALLLGLSIPPFDVHYFLWFGWAPFLYGVGRARRRRDAALAGAVFGILYYGLLFRSTLRLSVPVYAAAVAGSCAFAVLFAAGVRLMKRLPRRAQAPAIALLWAAPIFLSNNPIRPFFGSVIFLDGINTPLPAALLQGAHPFGEGGLAFFVMLINALVWLAVEAAGRDRTAYAACAGSLFMASWAWGAHALRTLPVPKASGFRLACAQHGLPFDNLWRSTHVDEVFAVYEKMALEAAKGGANMILFPQYQITEDIYRKPGRWAELARRTKLYLALGTYTPDVPGARRQMAWVITLVFSPEGKLIGEHRAIHPSPLSRSGVLSGSSADPIAVPGLGGVGVLPCFDDITPRPAAMFGKQSSLDVLFAIANDTMFEGTNQQELHLLRSRLRAVESRKYVVRCTPGGISAVIDPGGRVLDSLPSGQGLLCRDF